MPISLGELATRFGCELVGDPDTVVTGVASLSDATPDSLAFLSNTLYKKQLPMTKAAAVVLHADDSDDCPVAALLNDNPYATYARMAAVICPEPSFAPRVDTSAVISSSAIVADSAHIAANAVIGDRTTVGENVYVGPGTVIGPDCVVSDDCRLVSSVTFVKDVRVGARCIFHSGAVIGSDGFGNAMTREGWVKIPQLGGVQIGSDVEIGANSTVDCGSNGDTVLGNGVRIDNLCQIGHNVRIGDHTALVAQTVIAGSTVVGKRCMFAGAGGAVGHLHICDDVIVLAKSFVSKDITEAGTYAASFPAVKTKSWSRQVARFRRLDNLIERVKKLEK